VEVGVDYELEELIEMMCALDNIDESFTCFQVQVTRYLFICWKN